ncbi:MAG: TetR/AcrR family transcriptional regulator [Sandaracinaceae bacterium]
MAPSRRFENLPKEKQKAILDAAAAEFATQGFERASINQIVAAAELSKGSLYYYFEGKDDLYGAVMDDVMDRVEEVLRDIPTPTDRAGYWAMIREGMDRMERAFLHDEQLWKLGRGLYQRGDGDIAYQRLIARARAWVRKLLELGQHTGAVRDDVPITLLADTVTGMLLAMDRWFVMAMGERTRTELMALMPKTIDLVREFLAPKPEPEEEP